ncbi:MAG: XisI protein [Nostoc sp. ChiSLP02]|nr:XisI protein [Nostoc sp. DedSLP05]MDZ8097825.1 XisI protein [Nostoc sp. DedSLP01]MDZ8183910.1 XisI protein [Nostoc sp. ChiSLP02]
MDKLTEYPKIIKRILYEYVELSNRSSNRDIERFLIIDEPKGHNIWMNLGWQNGERITGMTVYVRIRDGKFWIEEDWTENGIANDLVRAGVPKEDIVLAFHEPKMRQHTDFAVAS